MAFVRLAIAGVLFIVTSGGLGYLADRCVSGRKWSRLLLGLALVFIATLWPIFILAFKLWTGRDYVRQHPHDDAPAMVIAGIIYVVAPTLFIMSLLISSLGVSISRRRNPRLPT